MQLWLSPLIGGILALVLYLIFASKVLAGAIFPDFENTDSRYTNFRCFLLSIKFATNMDAAKMLLWAFAAGFSERFVPNILNDMAKKANGG